MEHVLSFEEALKVIGHPNVDFSNYPESMREYARNHYEAAVRTEAFNGEWKADWNNPNQKKWIPIFQVDASSPSGLVFDYAVYCCSYADAGDASRLCFETKAKAEAAGREMIENFAGIILK